MSRKSGVSARTASTLRARLAEPACRAQFLAPCTDHAFGCRDRAADLPIWFEPPASTWPSSSPRSSRYHPMRAISAKPFASFWSDLLIRIDSAALAWRASRQTTGKPCALSWCQSQLDSEPVSKTIRSAFTACCWKVSAIASGLVGAPPLECHIASLVQHVNAGFFHGNV